MRRSVSPPLGPLENSVMQILWSRKQATADEVRTALVTQSDLKDSTIRTILRRLELKGYVKHDIEGRTYIYRPKVQPQRVATTQVQGIIDRFCRGSVESLLIGMVDDKLITPEKLRELADQISQAEAREPNPPAARRRK